MTQNYTLDAIGFDTIEATLVRETSFHAHTVTTVDSSTVQLHNEGTRLVTDTFQ